MNMFVRSLFTQENSLFFNHTFDDSASLVMRMIAANV